MKRRNLGEHQVVFPVPMSFALSAVGIGDEAPSLMAVPAEHLGAHVEHEERPVKPGRAENTVGQGVQFAGFDQAGHDHRRYDGSWARQTGGDHKPRLGDDVAVVVALRDLAFLLDAQRIGRPGRWGWRLYALGEIEGRGEAARLRDAVRAAEAAAGALDLDELLRQACDRVKWEMARMDAYPEQVAGLE